MLKKCVFLIVLHSFLWAQDLLANPLRQAKDSLYLTTILIEGVPSNTPHDVSLYLAADYRGWFPDIENCKFISLNNGTFILKLPHNQEEFGYKITRGSWDSVEGRSNGRARPNRIYNIKKDGSQLKISIESWEDLSKGSYNLYVYLLYLASIQAILLIFAINTIRNKNRQANGVLSVLLLLLAVALIGRASTYDPDVFNLAPKLLLAPEIILFTYGPVFYIYIHYLLKIPLPSKKYLWLQFVPAFTHILLYLPYLSMDRQTFIYRVLDIELFPVFATSGSVALIFNLVYWFLCYKTIRKAGENEKGNNDYQKYISFLNVVLRIKAIYLVLWIFLSLVFVGGWIIGEDTLWIAEISVDVLWVLFSLIIVCLAYFAMKQPELFTSKKQEQKYKDSSLPKEEIEKIKKRLTELIDQQKNYTNPDLTLPELSNKIPTTVHTLSRVINEGFEQTFSQFINEKRVQEFIRIVDTGQKFDSFLSLAFSVGFNSKATFNRSFKKFTGTTPRLYFNKESVK